LICALPLSNTLKSLDLALSSILFTTSYYIRIVLIKSVLFYFYFDMSQVSWRGDGGQFSLLSTDKTEEGIEGVAGQGDVSVRKYVGVMLYV